MVSHSTPRERIPGTMGLEAGLAPGPLQMVQSKQKTLAPARNRTLAVKPTDYHYTEGHTHLNYSKPTIQSLVSSIYINKIKGSDTNIPNCQCSVKHVAQKF